MSEENELPGRWTVAHLGSFTNIIGGSTPSRKEDRYFGGDIIWLTPTEIPKGTVSIISDSKEKLTEEGFNESGVRWIPTGSVLLTSRASIGYVAIAGTRLTTNQGFASFVLSEGFEPKYLGWWLRSQKEMLEDLAKGTTFKEISKTTLKDIVIPIAPANEQTRIVAAIEQQFTRLDAGVVALKRAKAKLKRYRAAVLKAAVEGKLTETWRAEHPTTEPASQLLERILKERRAKWEDDLRAKGKDPAKVKYVEPAAPDVEGLPELPEGWCWARVDQLITYLRNGLPQKPEASPPGHRILRINAVRPMSVDLDEVRYLFLPQQQLEGYLLDNGDLLFTRYNGSLELLGVAGLVRGCSLPTLHPDKLIRVKTVLAEPLSLYIELASNVGISRTYIESKARTTAGQTGISGSDIRQIPIPLPSLKEQEQIVSEAERHLSLISQLETTVEANLKRAERLRQSILSEAFAGRLVPQDPTDEPASLLLERIRNERNGQKNGTGVNDKKSRSVRVPEPVTLDIVEAEQTELWESVGN